jgi:hypothetical protein
MSGLCKFKNIFGVPAQGVHSYRVFNIAIVDVLVTILLSGGLAYWMKWNIPKTIAIAFVAGIVFHRLFCVRTTIDKLLFPNAS